MSFPTWLCILSGTNDWKTRMEPELVLSLIQQTRIKNLEATHESRACSYPRSNGARDEFTVGFGQSNKSFLSSPSCRGGKKGWNVLARVWKSCLSVLTTWQAAMPDVVWEFHWAEGSVCVRTNTHPQVTDGRHRCCYNGCFLLRFSKDEPLFFWESWWWGG